MRKAILVSGLALICGCAAPRDTFFMDSVARDRAKSEAWDAKKREELGLPPGAVLPVEGNYGASRLRRAGGGTTRH
jgi:hypothetical protein